VLSVFVDLSHIPVSARLRWPFESLLIPDNCFFWQISVCPKARGHKRTTDVVTDFKFKKVESERLLIGEYHNFFRAAQSGDMFTVSAIF
jgi:hypothetical protein